MVLPQSEGSRICEPRDRAPFEYAASELPSSTGGVPFPDPQRSEVLPSLRHAKCDPLDTFNEFGRRGICAMSLADVHAIDALDIDGLAAVVPALGAIAALCASTAGEHKIHVSEISELLDSRLRLGRYRCVACFFCPFHRTLTFVPLFVFAEPKRITEVDRVSPRKPVEIEPAGQPDGVFLRETTPSAVVRRASPHTLPASARRRKFSPCLRSAGSSAS